MSFTLRWWFTDSFKHVFHWHQVHKNEDGDVTLKLADFGLAMEVVKPIFMVCGTPTYVAPEILTHTGQYQRTRLPVVRVVGLNETYDAETETRPRR